MSFNISEWEDLSQKVDSNKGPTPILNCDEAYKAWEKKYKVGDEVLNFPTLYSQIPSTAPVVSPTGIVLGYNWNNFITAPTYSGTLQSAIPIGPSYFWSNCLNTGLISTSVGTCVGGTSISSGQIGMTGASFFALNSGNWLGNSGTLCNNIYPLVCACVKSQ